MVGPDDDDSYGNGDRRAARTHARTRSFTYAQGAAPLDAHSNPVLLERVLFLAFVFLCSVNETNIFQPVGLCFNQDSTIVVVFFWGGTVGGRLVGVGCSEARTIDSCHFQLNIDPRVVFIKFYYSAGAGATRITERNRTRILIWSFINL